MTATCHGVNTGFLSIASYSAMMASRSCGFVESGPEPCLLRRLPCTCDQHVLEVRLLAPDAVHADAARDVADQPQARPRFDRLLLAGVAREHHLGAVALGQSCRM